MDPNYNKTPVFDEDNIRTYKYPFGEMAREILSESPVIDNADQPPQLIIDLAELDENAGMASNEETNAPANSVPVQPNFTEPNLITDEVMGSSAQQLHKQLLNYMMSQLKPFEKGVARTNSTLSNLMDMNNLVENGTVNSQQMQYLEEYVKDQLQSFAIANANETKLPISL